MLKLALKLNASDTTILKAGLLKNADSTSNRTFSDLKYLKNADSTSNRTFSDLKYLKNADSTTLKAAGLWMILGFVVYFLYSRKNSKLNK